MTELVRSEYTKDMTEDYAEQTAQEVASMTPKQLRGYTDGLEPDSMGFSGKEGI